MASRALRIELSYLQGKVKKCARDSAGVEASPSDCK